MSRFTESRYMLGNERVECLTVLGVIICIIGAFLMIPGLVMTCTWQATGFYGKSTFNIPQRNIGIILLVVGFCLFLGGLMMTYITCERRKYKERFTRAQIRRDQEERAASLEPAFTVPKPYEYPRSTGYEKEELHRQSSRYEAGEDHSRGGGYAERGDRPRPEQKPEYPRSGQSQKGAPLAQEDYSFDKGGYSQDSSDRGVSPRGYLQQGRGYAGTDPYNFPKLQYPEGEGYGGGQRYSQPKKPAYSDYGREGYYTQQELERHNPDSQESYTPREGRGYHAPVQQKRQPVSTSRPAVQQTPQYYSQEHKPIASQAQIHVTTEQQPEHVQYQPEVVPQQEEQPIVRKKKKKKRRPRPVEGAPGETNPAYEVTPGGGIVESHVTHRQGPSGGEQGYYYQPQRSQEEESHA